ncbi:hypothetical protein KVR801_10171 [Klebsiella variicola]|nr:hypothetical protein KVR801_10171 [Klebsiella variicola]
MQHLLSWHQIFRFVHAPSWVNLPILAQPDGAADPLLFTLRSRSQSECPPEARRRQDCDKMRGFWSTATGRHHDDSGG